MLICRLCPSVGTEIPKTKPSRKLLLLVAMSFFASHHRCLFYSQLMSWIVRYVTSRWANTNTSCSCALCTPHVFKILILCPAFWLCNTNQNENLFLKQFYLFYIYLYWFLSYVFHTFFSLLLNIIIMDYCLAFFGNCVETWNIMHVFVFCLYIWVTP